MVCPSFTCGARRSARSAWPVAGSGTITTSAPATATAISVVARSRRARPCRPSATSVSVGSPASGPSADAERLQRRTRWPASARSAAVANPPLPPPSTATFIRRRGSRDGAGRSELGDLHVRVLEYLGEDLVRVLAEPGRRRHVETHRAVQLDRRPERTRLAVERMRHLHDHAALGHLGIAEHAVDALDRRGRNVESLEPLEPVLRRPRAERGLDQRHQDLAVDDAIAILREAHVALPFRVVDRAAERAPELLREDRDDQVAVTRLQRLVRDHRGVARAHRNGDPAVGPEVLRDVREQRDLAVEERQIDLAALPGALAAEERAGDREGTEHPAGQVGHRQAHADRAPVGLAGDGHGAAHRLQREVERGPVAVRSLLAVGGDRADDDPLVERPELRVREAQALHDAGAEIFPDHVRLTDELVEHLAATLAVEVERERFLVAIDRQEVRRLAVGQERRAHAPHRVAAIRILDLDHLGALVGEQHRAVRSREHTREVEDANAFEELHFASHRGWCEAAHSRSTRPSSIPFNACRVEGWTAARYTWPAIGISTRSVSQRCTSRTMPSMPKGHSATPVASSSDAVTSVNRALTFWPALKRPTSRSSQARSRGAATSQRGKLRSPRRSLGSRRASSPSVRLTRRG